MDDNKIKFYFVFAVAGRIIYWLICAAIGFVVWQIILDLFDGPLTIAMSTVAGAILGVIYGKLWFYLYDN